ncbi:MAG: hypothetical protein CBC48_16035 [bacterium TMED88]|nr:hypothetical protein [Deltaproteobacteria bacterium]OUV25758.1 MAG: hypothetical protein CBC48_16035 [bacterium TMED88]
MECPVSANLRCCRERRRALVEIQQSSPADLAQVFFNSSTLMMVAVWLLMRIRFVAVFAADDGRNSI